VITRLNLTWEGHGRSAPDPPLSRRSAFRIIAMMVVFQWVINVSLRIVVCLLEGDFLRPETHASTLLRSTFGLLACALLWKETSVKKGLMTVFILVQVFWGFELCYGFDKDESSRVSYVGRYMHELASCSSFTISTMIIRNVRHYVRAKYDIRPALFTSDNPQEASLEDSTLAVWCPHLATSQLLRHTTDYRKFGCSICSDRGLPHGAPGIV
jgi:hypothetical protein